jgi:hypothetical protein
MRKIIQRKFVACFFLVGFDNISLGVSFNWYIPNIEIHLPFGFIKIGWDSLEEPWDSPEETKKYCERRTFGINNQFDI